MTWIFFTIFAAFMQSIRTAGQKKLTADLSSVTVSWARYGFGLPVALAYLATLSLYFDFEVVTLPIRFWLFVVLASVAQLAATVLLVMVLSLRNFAVATTYAKTEPLLAAVFAFAVFHRSIDGYDWLAIALGCIGIAFVSVRRSHLSVRSLLANKAAVYGLAAGVCFAITSVLLREASLASRSEPMITAAFVLSVSIVIQGLLCTVLVHREDPSNWRRLKKHMGIGWFIGVTGALGSIGWFTAFALQEAALVKTLGQIEFLFTVLITTLFFKERIRRYEWIGMTLVVLSILVLLQT